MDIHGLILKDVKRDWKDRFWSWYYNKVKWKLQYKWPFKQLGEACYWLRTHTYNRYHMLDIRNKRNGYEWGWMDRCEGIVFANFAILVDFVEKEKPFVHVDWTSDDDHINAAKEIRDLYRWWKVERKRDHDLYEEHLEKTYGFENCIVFEKDNTMVFTKRGDPEWEAECELSREVEESLIQIDTSNLIRLINIRSFLWT